MAEKEKPTLEEIVGEEVVEAAKAAHDESKTKVAKSGVGVLRTSGGAGAKRELQESEIPYPTGAHGEDFEDYGPAGMASVIPEGVERQAISADQEFMIDPEKVRYLVFDRPGRNLPKKRLYNIKAFHKDGRLVQLPFEEQIQNNAGGDPEDAIGMRRYERKGITILMDWTSLKPVYCAAWDCWAEAAQEGDFVGFCTLRHAQHTLPNRYKDAGQIAQGVFGENATTSRTWSV